MSFVSDAAVRRLRAVAGWPEFAGPRYCVVREIGRGGMGTVYLGRDEELGRDVAIKVTNGAAAGGALETRMRMEARIVAALEHPGIVPVHDVGTLADGRLFIVMKLVRGVTLAQHVKQAAELPERLRLFERICEPVAFAHARGTVHRDLKPSNVMVGLFGEVLIMDWGVAKELRPGEAREAREAGEAGAVMGTLGYMAPEQTAARPDVDARADVHGLGAILFALITGQEPPVDSASVPAELARRRRIPKRLRAICARAMAADPGQRYADAAALAEDVARLRAGAPVSAYPETTLDRVARVAVTYRTPILLVLTYLVVRALIAIFFHR